MALTIKRIKPIGFVVISALLFAQILVFRPVAPQAAAQEPLACAETYTVQQDDWLSKIAQKYYGDPLAYDRLVTAANADSGDEYTDIENPDLIEPGWLLCIDLDGQTGQSTESTGNSTTTVPQLAGPVWQWAQSGLTNGMVWEPNNPANYTVQFNPNGQVAIQADCNQVSGSYIVEGSSLSIALGPRTMAACGPQSVDDQFLAQLGDATVYFFQNGSLFIGLVADSGTMQFNPAGVAGGEPPAASLPTTLQGKTWQWEKQVNPTDGSESAVNKPASYTLNFNTDGTYRFQADCNHGSGNYTADDTGRIRFQAGPIAMSECGPGSRSQDMLNMMQAVQDYRLEEGGGVLVLVWPAGGPEDVYRAQ